MIVVRFPRDAGARSCSTAPAAQAPDLAKRLGSTSCARRSRSPTKARTRRRRLLGRRRRTRARRRSSTPIRATRGSAAGDPARAEAAAFGDGALATYEALRIAFGVAERRRRFRLRRRLSPRRQLRSPQRRRLRQGLLCRPGGRLAHEASRDGAQAGRARPARSRRPAAGNAGARRRAARRRRSARRRAATRWRCSGSTGSRRRGRPAGPLTAGGVG